MVGRLHAERCAPLLMRCGYLVLGLGALNILEVEDLLAPTNREAAPLLYCIRHLLHQARVGKTMLPRVSLTRVCIITKVQHCLAGGTLPVLLSAVLQQNQGLVSAIVYWHCVGSAAVAAKALPQAVVRLAARGFPLTQNALSPSAELNSAPNRESV